MIIKRQRIPILGGGQISEINYQDGTQAIFEYNAAGQLVEARNEAAEVLLERNILGQIAKETVNGESITHEYNELGQRTSMQSSLGADMNFEFDSFGQLVKHNANGWQSEFEYDNFGFEVNRTLQGGISQQSTYDSIGRLTGQQITGGGGKRKHFRKYQWGVNDRLQSIIDSATGTTEYRYSKTGHLEYAKFGNDSEQYRAADRVGNLYETKEKKDCVYDDFNHLEKKGCWHYKYDILGNLVEKYKRKQGLFSSKSDHWQYRWNAQGMLQEVTRPDQLKVHFTYDALGRRLTKKFKSTTTKWLWNGNVPLHEWKENYERNFTEEGKEYQELRKHSEVTWIFEEDSFVPCGKVKNNKKYSILADHLDTPTQMYNEEGESIWERSLDMNGKVQEGSHRGCPFMYQGQYYDEEIELAYNRFRYYDPEVGRYIAKDPIGLASGEFGFYNYVDDSNTWIDPFGLAKSYHANDRRNTKAQHGYEIYDKNDNVVKTGVSSGRIRKDGKSSRAEKQVRDWNEDKTDPNGPYTSKIKKKISSQPGARGKILDWEQSNATKHKKTLDPLKHKLLKP